jgi:hypothetical protein
MEDEEEKGEKLKFIFSEWLGAVSKLSLYVGALSFDCDQAVQHHRALGA